MFFPLLRKKPTEAPEKRQRKKEKKMAKTRKSRSRSITNLTVK